jgi:hypothetical protein
MTKHAPQQPDCRSNKMAMFSACETRGLRVIGPVNVPFKIRAIS